MGFKKGDMVEIFFDEDIYEAIGRPQGLYKHFGISPIEDYENRYWIIRQDGGDIYILEGDTMMYSWPKWLLRKANPTPDWEV